jgi:hypothetical protein
VKVVVLPSHRKLNDGVQIAQIGVACDFQAAPNHGADAPQGNFQLVDVHAQQSGTDELVCVVLAKVSPNFLCSHQSARKPLKKHLAWIPTRYSSGIGEYELQAQHNFRMIGNLFSSVWG